MKNTKAKGAVEGVALAEKFGSHAYRHKKHRAKDYDARARAAHSSIKNTKKG